MTNEHETETAQAIADWTPDPSSSGEVDDQIKEDVALEAELAKERKARDEQAEQFSTQGMTVEELSACIETLLFLSDKPIQRKRLKELLGEDLDFDAFEQALELLHVRTQSPSHGIQLVEVAGGYQLRTKPSQALVAHRLVKVRTERLSRGAMETLALVAYKQPVMKEEVDKVRGVDSSHFIRRLLDKQLVEVSGRSELPGRPMLYSTTPHFLELFSINGLADLPPLREIEKMIPASEVAPEGADGKRPEDPRVRDMRKMVHEMNGDKGSLNYDPRHDEKFLSEIRERVSGIMTTTPTLVALAEAVKAEKEGNSGQIEVSEPPIDLFPETKLDKPSSES